MSELSVNIFVPIVAELQDLAKEAQAVDITNKKAVREVRLKLKNKRVEVTKKCKEFRDDANAFAKAVIAKEKELVAIIEPEEERFKEIEAAAKLEKEREERRALLPKRLERLASIGDNVEVTEDELLNMDGSFFEGYFNQRLAAKNEADRAEIEAREREIKEKEEAQQREAEAKEREEKARQEERERIEREQKEKEEREAKEKKEAEEKAERDRVAKEEAGAEEKRKFEAQQGFQAWLKKNGRTEENKEEFKLVDNGDSVSLFKLVGNYKK